MNASFFFRLMAVMQLSLMRTNIFFKLLSSFCLKGAESTLKQNGKNCCSKRDSMSVNGSVKQT
jgi:hypothetical protein